MPTRNITEFSTATNLLGDDLIHLGRSVADEPIAANRDKAITGTDFFNVINSTSALLGAPSVPADVLVGGVRSTLQDYSSGISTQGVFSALDGTITIFATGLYRVTANLIAAAPNDFDFNIGLFLVWDVGDLAISGSAIPNRAGAGAAINLAGGTLVQFTAGHVVELQLEADAAINPITFPNGTFEISPVFIS
jgi:hypothetical protein